MAAADDEAGLAQLCGRVLSDRGLAESLIARGKQRASEFTLERMGAQLLAVYRQVLERSP
jgi:glycosyltransferase involved in cell wall biosynthesis